MRAAGKINLSAALCFLGTNRYLFLPMPLRFCHDRAIMGINQVLFISQEGFAWQNRFI